MGDALVNPFGPVHLDVGVDPPGALLAPKDRDPSLNSDLAVDGCKGPRDRCRLGLIGSRPSLILSGIFGVHGL